MGKIFAVISGKGGTGKSTVSAGLSAALSLLGQRVLLIDLDEGLRCLDTMLGIEKNIVFDLGDVLSGHDVADAIYDLPQMAGVALIPAPRERGSISADRLCALIAERACHYDVILLDFPAGIDDALMRAVADKAEFIAVCNPDPISVKDAAAVCEAIGNTESSVRLLLNRFSVFAVKSTFRTNIDDIIDGAGVRLLGIVPESEDLGLFCVKHTVPRRSGAGKAFYRIARRMLGVDVKLPPPRKIV